MSSVNASTGFTLFQLHLRRVPRTIPPVSNSTDTTTGEGLDDKGACELILRLENNMMEAQDNLLAAKAAQATQVNTHRALELGLKAGDKVMLSTKHRRRDYIMKGDKHVAK
ncbi:uncharacterized protein HD556DRAFT_1220599, partial [Suillus plorans]